MTSLAAPAAPIRCWVIRTTGQAAPGGDHYRWGAEVFDPHYFSEAEARDHITETRAGYDGEDQAPPDLYAGELAYVCLTLTCTQCDAVLEDWDTGSILHLADAAEAARIAAGSGWTTDGRDWHCESCPRLDNGEPVPAMPGPLDQPLF